MDYRLEMRRWACLLAVVCSALVVCAGHVTEDDNQCDWDVWDNTEHQGVRTVHVGCTSGHVGWHHPYGAVNLHLRLPNAPMGFIVCFSATAVATTATISLDNVIDNNGDTAKNQANPGTENTQTSPMERLVTLDAAHSFPGTGTSGSDFGTTGSETASVREVCIESSRGEPVKLYLEAEMHHESTMIGHVEIDYDIEPISKKRTGQEDDMEECRPCTDDELLLAVCNSDFIVQGVINAVEHLPEYDESEMSVHVTKMHRQSQTVFQPLNTPPQHVPESKLQSPESREPESRGVSLKEMLRDQMRIRAAQIIAPPRLNQQSLSSKRGSIAGSQTIDDEDYSLQSSSKELSAEEVSQSLSSSHNSITRTQRSSNKDSMSSSHTNKDSRGGKAASPAALYSGAVIAPYRCHVRAGEGSYLFMGRVRLKRAVLKCAPRIEDFARVYKKAVAAGRHKCTFQV